MTRDEALDILGIPKDASFDLQEIKKRYRALMGKIHPDKAGDDGHGGSTGLAKSLNTAREVLIAELGKAEKRKTGKESAAAKAQREAYERQQRQKARESQERKEEPKGRAAGAGEKKRRKASSEKTEATPKPKRRGLFRLSENRMLFLDYSFRVLPFAVAIAYGGYVIAVDVFGITAEDLRKFMAGGESTEIVEHSPRVIACEREALFAARQVDENAKTYFELRMVQVAHATAGLGSDGGAVPQMSGMIRSVRRSMQEMPYKDFALYLPPMPGWYSGISDRKHFEETGAPRLLSNALQIWPQVVEFEPGAARCGAGFRTYVVIDGGS